MMGRSHALSGAVTGAALGLTLLHTPRPQTALLAVLCAGGALRPDIDHRDASVARTFGFLTKAFAWLVGKLSGGHRHLTHSLFGAAASTAATMTAVHYRHTVPGRIGLGFDVALLLASAMRALRIGGHYADVLAIAGAAGIVWSGYGLALVPWAVGAGCATHILGDGLTDEGVPLFSPLSKRRIRLLPEPLAFKTDTAPERWVIVPALYASLAVIAVWGSGLGRLALHAYTKA